MSTILPVDSPGLNLTVYFLSRFISNDFSSSEASVASSSDASAASVFSVSGLSPAFDILTLLCIISPSSAPLKS